MSPSKHNRVYPKSTSKYNMIKTSDPWKVDHQSHFKEKPYFDLDYNNYAFEESFMESTFHLSPMQFVTLMGPRNEGTPCRSRRRRLQDESLPTGSNLATSWFLMVCGGVSTVLGSSGIVGSTQVSTSVYMIFGLLAGLMSLVLGIIGLWASSRFSNRNFISGFVSVGIFNGLCCVGLVSLTIFISLSYPPHLIDFIGGAVAALSCLTLLMALIGLSTSCCCLHPPPDDRVIPAVCNV